MVDLKLHGCAKVRGAQIDEPLSTQSIEDTPRTRTLLARLVGQCFEYLHVIVGPALAQLKICFSLLTEALPTGDWDTCCSTVNTDLDNQIRNVLKSLIDCVGSLFVEFLSRNLQS